MRYTTDEYDYKMWVSFDFAICAVFTSLVFDLSKEIGVHRYRIHASEYWTKSRAKLDQGWRGILEASLHAIAGCMLIIIAAAVGIAIPSHPLEERMLWILEGLSFLFAACVLGMLAFQVAVWLGIYYYPWQHYPEETSRCLKEIKFRVFCRNCRIFGRYFFFLLPFFQGVNAETIPVSMVAGVLIGFFVDYCVYMARRKQKDRPRIRKAAKLVVVGIIVFSSFMLAQGMWAIAFVWDSQNDPRKDDWRFWSLVVSLILEFVVHGGFWWYSSRMLKLLPESETTISVIVMSPHRPRMATSIFFDEPAEMKKNNDNEKDEPSPSTLEMPCIRERDEEPDPNVSEVSNDAQPNDNTLEVDEGGTGHIPITQTDSSNDEHDDEYNRAHTYKKMFLGSWKCCGCVRDKDRNRLHKTLSFLSWTVWFVLVFGSLWLVIVNLNATVQQEAVRDKLPEVFEKVYRYIDEGEVCAFDNKGPDSNITTFENKDAAHDAGFLILHCGACGACSDWHNLGLEYTTRDTLAHDSAYCARKSLLGGRDAVLECLKEEPIGFQGQCAECWVDDILCTKSFCTFIFLQSTMINAVSNLQVNDKTITSAACEEAHCEAGNPGYFVECSGATRRRMNVTSSISRPGAQRCGIVDVDWEELFG